MLVGVYASPIQAYTLVNHWSFNGNLNDTSGNHNNGTLVGSGSSYVPGVFGGQGLYLSANDKNTNTSAVGLPTAGNADWSMNLWLYLTNTPISLAYIAGFGNINTSGGAYNGTARGLIAYGSPNNQGIYFWGEGNDMASGVAYALNQWVMLTITHSGSMDITDIYTNGVNIFEGGESFVNIPSPYNQYIQVNYSPLYATSGFNGIIDEFTLWSGVLSSNEIVDLYTSNAVPGATNTGD